MNNYKEDIFDNDIESKFNLNEDDAIEFKEIHKNFIKSYILNKDKMSLNEWLTSELSKNLPDKSPLEIQKISSEIIDTIKISEEKKISLEKAIKNGRSKENWFSSDLKKSMSNMSTAQSAKYLHELDEAIKTANQSMYDTITTKSGAINQNLNLDGFIAEQHHANSFNLNANAKNSNLKAEVLKPKSGQTYSKNSVDVVIKDNTGKIIERYQAKYGKTAEDTIRMIKEGNYNNQRLLVPAEQLEEVQKAFPNKTVVSQIGSGDVKSNPLEKIRAKELQQEAQSGNWNDLNWNEYKSKDLAVGIGKQAAGAALQGALEKIRAKELQQEAQSGNWNDLNWNEYKSKDLAVGIGKQAAGAALQGAAIGVGFHIAQKVWNGEEIEAGEVVEQALVSGADFGVKAATAGALKVGAEKGILKVIPKGTPAATIANIAHVGIENVKIIGKIVTGELTMEEGLEKMEQTTVATLAGISCSAKGTAMGAAVGTVFGPAGTLIGGFIGGTIGYIAGSKFGEVVVKTSQKFRKKVVEKVKEFGNGLVSGFESALNRGKNFLKSILPL